MIKSHGMGVIRNVGGVYYRMGLNFCVWFVSFCSFNLNLSSSRTSSPQRRYTDLTVKRVCPLHCCL